MPKSFVFVLLEKRFCSLGGWGTKSIAFGFLEKVGCWGFGVPK